MERQYFYLLDNEKCGPFVLADLIDVNLPQDILVWHEGLADWVPAGTLPELQDMYQAPQPQAPIPNQMQTRRMPQGNPTLKFFRIALAVVLLFFAIALVGSGMENDPIQMTPFVMAAIFLAIGLWLLLKKSKFKRGNVRNDDDYTAADGAIYAEQMNMLSQDDDYSDDGSDFD